MFAWAFNMSHWHFITRKQPELHMLPERVGNSHLSQNQLLVDVVKNLFSTKTIFSRNLIHFEIRFWQSLRYYNWALLSLFKCKLVIDCMSTVIQPPVSLFTDLKQLIIYHIWWVKTPIRHGKLLASPVMLKDIKLLFQLVSLLDALSFLSFLRIKFTVKPFMYISMTAIHGTYKAELKSYLQSLNNTVQV